MKAELITDADGFAGIEPEWRELAMACGNAFLSPEWARAWTEDGGESPLVAAATEGGRLAGVVPLALDTSRSPPAVRFPGARFGDRFGIACDPAHEGQVAEAAMRSLDEAMGSSPLLVLNRIDRRSDWPGRMAAASARRMAMIEQSDAVLPHVPIAGLDWDAYVASRSKKFGQRIARGLERALDRDGVAHRVRETSDAGALRGDLNTFWRLHDLRRPARGDSSVADPGSRARLERFARAALERGWLRLRTLELDGEPAAGLLCWLFGPTYAVYQSGFDPAWAEREPGMTLMNDTVRSAIAEDAEDFDMLLGREPYKRRFTSEDRRVHTVMIVGARRPLRLLAATEAAARRRGRRLARRPGIGRVLHAVARRLPGA